MYKYFFIFLIFSACIPLQNNQPDNLNSLSRVEELNSKGISLLTLYDEKKKSEDLESAYSAFSLALQLNKEDPKAIDGVASVLIRKGNFLEAEKMLYHLTSTNENYARGYVNLSYLKEKKGNLKEAEFLLRKSLSIDPLEPHALNNLGGIIFDRGIKNNNQFDIKTGRELIYKASLIIDKKNKVIKQNLNAIKSHN